MASDALVRLDCGPTGLWSDRRADRALIQVEVEEARVARLASDWPWVTPARPLERRRGLTRPLRGLTRRWRGLRGHARTTRTNCKRAIAPSPVAPAPVRRTLASAPVRRAKKAMAPAPVGATRLTQPWSMRAGRTDAPAPVRATRLMAPVRATRLMQPWSIRAGWTLALAPNKNSACAACKMRTSPC